MTEYVFAEVVRTWWHIDGLFQPAPFPYSLYHMVSVPLKGDTVFAPLNGIVDNLPSVKRNEWERLWMMSIVSCMFTVYEPLQLDVFDTYKECAINKASLFLSTNEKSSQLTCRSLIPPKYHHYSSYSSYILMHLPNLGTNFKNSVMIEIGCWHVMRLVHHFTTQTKKPVVQFGPLRQHARSWILQ